MERCTAVVRIPDASGQRRSEITEAGNEKMADVKSVLRMVGMVLLAVFVLSVTIPLVFKAVGLTFAILGFLVWLAMQLIYIVVVIAIAYLLLVGIRALLR